MGQKMRCLDVDEDRELMVTVGTDKVVKIWSLKGVL